MILNRQQKRELLNFKMKASQTIEDISNKISKHQVCDVQDIDIDLERQENNKKGSVGNGESAVLYLKLK